MRSSLPTRSTSVAATCPTSPRGRSVASRSGTRSSYDNESTKIGNKKLTTNYCDISQKPKKLFFPPLIGPKKVGPLIKYVERSTIDRVTNQTYAEEVRRKYSTITRDSPYHRDYTRLKPKAMRFSKSEKERREREDIESMRNYSRDYNQRVNEDVEKEKLRCCNNMFSPNHKDLRILMIHQ